MGDISILVAIAGLALTCFSLGYEFGINTGAKK